MIDPASVRQAAEQLLQQHGLHDWRFEFDNAPARRGQCNYRRKTISYSTAYLESPPQAIINTLLHEVAHAIVGPHHHHDDTWRATAQAIGCTGERCSTGHTQPEHRYTLTCRTCGNTWKRHKLAFRFPLCPRCRKMLHIHDSHEA